MTRKLLIRDLTLRDGQQSQFATRMNQKQVDRVLPLFKKAHFYAMEVWGGAVPDSIMRYLNENPWRRLESIRDGIGDASKLAALSRGRNLFGYNPYPDETIEGFCRNSVQSGIGIMRIFDALNDLSNQASTIRFVKENGGLADCCICYTVDPHFTFGDRMRALFSGRKLPSPIFTVDYFVAKAKELEKMGADIISVKDMAGLIHPKTAGELTRGLKGAVSVPIDLHTHCTPGYGLGSVLMSMVNGADIVDTVIMPFAGGPAAPAFELVQIFADKLGLDTGVDLTAIAPMQTELMEIRRELCGFDQYKMFPKLIDPADYKLDPEINALFDAAIVAAKKEDIAEVLRTTQAIERYYNFPEPDELVRVAQVPGGMYTNMLSQLQQANLGHLLKDVLASIPQVRLDAGLPPLVTPTSQIVGIQAVNCIIDRNAGKPFYTNKSIQFVNLVKGVYGKTPFPVDPEFRLKIAGTRTETPYDTAAHKKEDNPALPDCGGMKLAKDEKEALLLELFPQVARNYLKKVRDNEWAGIYRQQVEEEQGRVDAGNAPIFEGLRGNLFAAD
ncbi:MAG TPA: carboxylase [bacterium]|nr:carboxylase [bacterium]